MPKIKPRMEGLDDVRCVEPLVTESTTHADRVVHLCFHATTQSGFCVRVDEVFLTISEACKLSERLEHVISDVLRRDELEQGDEKWK